MYNERPAFDAVLSAQPSAILNVTPGTRSALAFVNDWLAAIEQLEAPVCRSRSAWPASDRQFAAETDKRSVN
jgi:hypothetical protein